MLDKAFVTLGLPLPQPTVETGDAAMVRGLLQGSDMLAAVSASQMRFETDNGLLSVLPVPLPDTTRRIGLTFRARQPALPGDAGAVAFYLSAGSGRGRLTFTRHRIGYLLVARLLKRLQRLPAHRGVNMQVGYADHRAHFLQQEEAGAILN